MRRFLLIALLPVFALAGCATHHHACEGSWRLVELHGQPQDGKTVKIVTPTRFAFGVGIPQDNRVWAAGGRVQVTPETYTEIIEYHSNPEMVGQVLDCTYSIEDGLWHHQGELEIDGRRIVIDEVWERLVEQ